MNAAAREHPIHTARGKTHDKRMARKEGINFEAPRKLRGVDVYVSSYSFVLLGLRLPVLSRYRV